MKWVYGVLVAATLGAVAAQLHAGTFLQAYEGALANDPSYRAARQGLASTEQGVPIARSGLLPNLSLSVSDARVTGSRTLPNFLGQSVTTPLDYRSPQQTLSVRAPLLNVEAWRHVRQAQAQVSVAESILLTRRHELLDRLGQAYLQRLFTLQNQEVAQSQLETALEQRQLALRQFELGDGTRPDLQSAEANLALTRVQLLEADNQLANARLVLAQITGLPSLPVLPLADAFIAPRPVPAGLAAWLETARASNPDIVARRFAVEVARISVDRAGAGHYPRLDLVGSVSKGRNDSVSTLNQSLSQRSIGLQLNVPLYSGGLVAASVTQALADQEKAQAELEAEMLNVNADIQRLFLTVQSGLEKLPAQQQVLGASMLVLEGARKSAAGGVGIRADIVRAHSKVTEALRDRARFRYELVLALLRLHSRAGTTPEEIAQLLDTVLSDPTRTATR